MKTSNRSSVAFSLRRKTGRRIRFGLAAAFSALFAPGVSAAMAEPDWVHYQLPLAEIIRKSDAAPSEPERPPGISGRMTGAWDRADAWPHVWVEEPARVWLGSDQPHRRSGRVNLRVAVSAPRGLPVRGLLLLPGDDGQSEAVRIPFLIDPDSTESVEQEAIRPVVESHYGRLARISPVGQPWFRLRIRQAGEEADGNRELPRRSGHAPWEESFAFFSGGRAISENLALADIDLWLPKPEEPTLPLSGLRGITVEEVDWAELAPDDPPATDPLARLIPADQHALFFEPPSAFADFVRRWEKEGLPMLQSLDPVSVPPGLGERYLRQLGVSLDALGAWAEAGWIDSLALTGGDPFFAGGTDVALLIESGHPRKLIASLQAEYAGTAAREKGVALTETGETGGSLRLTGSGRRALAWQEEGAVILANADRQRDLISQTGGGKTAALADTGEYRFFRTRYPVGGDGGPGVFLLLSDETIRRWCGPEWRIGASRRLRAAAVLRDLTARQLDGKDRAGQLPETDPALADWLGGVEWTPQGPLSGRYHREGFLTPVGELGVDSVTEAEAAAYQRWRDVYESGWEEVFDPIAIRFDLTPDSLKFDLTVMPLIASTAYGWLRELAGEAVIGPYAGDAGHGDAIARLTVAVDPNSEWMRMLSGWSQNLGGGLGANPFRWMEGTVSLYLDDDPFWRELAESPEIDRFLQEHGTRLPAALHVESKDPIRLALFLTGLRNLIQETAPGTFRWETRSHAGHSYVAMVPTAGRGDRRGGGEMLEIYYAARPDAFVLSLREDVVQRSLERFAEETTGKAAGAKGLGDHLTVELGETALALLRRTAGEVYTERLRQAAWAPIGLLNDWKARFPERDPVETLATLWHIDPVCPAGGDYVWNVRDKTHESTRLGHPWSPAGEVPLPDLLREAGRLRLGLTFEHDGLRAAGEFGPGAEGKTSRFSPSLHWP